VLVGRVEGVAKIHEECVAVPPEVVLMHELENQAQWRRLAAVT
jgi:hypothetical protein